MPARNNRDIANASNDLKLDWTDDLLMKAESNVLVVKEKEIRELLLQ